jgi:hypothetical protein
MAGDGDIHFPPGRRREKPEFEPPPWEREQFEKLARDKQAEGPDSAGEPPQVSEQEPQVLVGAEGEMELQLDAARVEELMMELRAEEPRTGQFWRISIAVGVLSAVIGLSLVTWGVVALFTPTQAKVAAMVLALVLFGFGFGLAGGGVWLILKSLRQQGAL